MFATVIIELLCLMFLLFHLGHEYLFSKKNIFWKDGKHIVLLTIIFLSVIDICICTGLDEYGKPYIRLTRVLRPFVIVNIPEGRQVRRAFRNIRRTLPEIGSVLILFSLILGIFGLMVFKIFGKRGWHKINGSEYFSNFPDSYWDLYVLVTTANNPDIMMPAYNDNPWFCLFFIIFLVICLYIFMSIFLAVVYNNYRSNLKNEVHEAIKRKRTLLNTVFDLVRSEVDGKDVVKQEMFHQLMQATIPGKSQQYHKIVWCVLDADQNGFVDKKEFMNISDLLNIPVLEVLPNTFHTYIPSIYNSKYSKILKEMVKHKLFRYVFDAIIIVNAFFILFDIKGIEWGFLSLFMLEIFLKIYAFGFYMFIRKMWNIFDVVVIGSAFLISIAEVIRQDEFDSEVVLDITLVLRVLRIVKIFHSFPRFKIILNTIMHILPSMLTYASVLFVFFYFFAVIGIESFYGMITFYGYDEAQLDVDKLYCGNENLQDSEFYRLQYCKNNFNDILHAFVTLFELLVVNQWHVIAEGFQLAVGSKWTRVYFISFHCLSVIIILNIFTAFVLEIFILEYSFDRGSLETTLEAKINEMGLGLGSKPSKGSDKVDSAEASIIENDELASEYEYDDPDHDNLQFVANQLQEMAQKYQDLSKETPIRFHLHKAARNVQSLLEKLFVNEIKDALDQLEFGLPLQVTEDNTEEESTTSDKHKSDSKAENETYLHDSSSVFIG